MAPNQQDGSLSKKGNLHALPVLNRLPGGRAGTLAPFVRLVLREKRSLNRFHNDSQRATKAARSRKLRWRVWQKSASSRHSSVVAPWSDRDRFQFRTPTHFFPLLIMGPLATHDFVPSIELETSQTTPYDGLRALTIAPRKARDFLEPDSVLINVTRVVTLSSNGWEFTTRALSADLYEHFPDGRSRGAKSFELPGSQGVYPLPSRVRATTMAPYDREKIRTNPGLGGTALEISEEWMGRPLQ
ncbi:hypothetical protein H4582DRAFT_2056148 [Lactarius indigo]|nr:hypothetical protein H4582DRAFT_2056148 [Lactarius indigo]